MRTLILNGSPRSKGNTVYLINELTSRLNGETRVVNAFEVNVKACIDCRWCWKNEGCCVEDEMAVIYREILEYDAFVIASPLNFSELTAPLLSLLSRFQCYYAARRFLGKKLRPTGRPGGMIIVGGGDGGPEKAVSTATEGLRLMGAKCLGKALSLNTDALPAKDDEQAKNAVAQLALLLNNANSKPDCQS